MATRKHVHEEVMPAAPERVFTALYTPSAIRDWWGVARVVVIPRPGGFWAAAWGANEDDPDYVVSAVLADFDPPRRMVWREGRYHAKSGPLAFEADFATTFEVEPHPNGAVLRVTQDGFPIAAVADQFYADCQKGWRDTFAGLRRHLENKRYPDRAPALSDP